MKNCIDDFLEMYEEKTCGIGFVDERHGGCSTMLQQSLLLMNLLDGDGPFRIVRREDVEV